MTLKNFKDNLVNERHILSNKDADKLVINTSLTMLIFAGTVSLIISSILDVRVTLIAFVLFGLLFLWVLDYCCEDMDFLGKWLKFTKIWFVYLIFPVITVVILKIFNFL